jgi:hypothetical protein
MRDGASDVAHEARIPDYNLEQTTESQLRVCGGYSRSGLEH